MDNLNQAMNNIVLEDDEEGGLVFEEEQVSDPENQQFVCNAKLCLNGKFLTKGVLDFQAMQKTLAALWRPGRGVYIKELDTNLFLFQFLP